MRHPTISVKTVEFGEENDYHTKMNEKYDSHIINQAIGGNLAYLVFINK